MPRQAKGKVFPGRVPKFRLYRHKTDPNKIRVCCTSCHGWFTIDDVQKWQESLPDYDTRSCPYCMKVSYIRSPR